MLQSDFKEFLLKITNAKQAHEIEVIQSLWSGYGKIARIQLDGAAFETVVVKHISLRKANAHPRGWNTNISYDRKVKSYQVETYWYENYNQRCTSDCRTPQFLGSFSQDEGHCFGAINHPNQHQNGSVAKVGEDSFLTYSTSE